MNDKYNYDPNAPWDKSSIFWFPYKEEDSKLIIIPVPFAATVSDWDWAEEWPEIVKNQSSLLDFYNDRFPDWYKEWVFMWKISDEIKNLSRETRKIVIKIISHLENIEEICDEELIKLTNEVNIASTIMTKFVKNEAKRILELDKIPIVLGWDHSTPLWLIQALWEKYEKFHIIHIDAHADLRHENWEPWYEGFTQSHASIMANVLKTVPSVTHITQIWIRDFSEDEVNVAEKSKKVTIYTNNTLKDAESNWINWDKICNKILTSIPNEQKEIYISFDIDWLEPSLCPDTWTPVPWWLTYDQIRLLLEKLVEVWKKIIGFDLVEVSNWNNNNPINWKTWAIILKELCMRTLESITDKKINKKIKTPFWKI